MDPYSLNDFTSSIKETQIISNDKMQDSLNKADSAITKNDLDVELSKEKKLINKNDENIDSKAFQLFSDLNLRNKEEPSKENSKNYILSSSKKQNEEGNIPGREDTDIQEYIDKLKKNKEESIEKRQLQQNESTNRRNTNNDKKSKNSPLKETISSLAKKTQKKYYNSKSQLYLLKGKPYYMKEGRYKDRALYLNNTLHFVETPSDLLNCTFKPNINNRSKLLSSLSYQRDLLTNATKEFILPLRLKSSPDQIVYPNEEWLMKEIEDAIRRIDNGNKGKLSFVEFVDLIMTIKTLLLYPFYHEKIVLDEQDMCFIHKIWELLKHDNEYICNDILYDFLILLFNSCSFEVEVSSQLLIEYIKVVRTKVEKKYAYNEKEVLYIVLLFRRVFHFSENNLLNEGYSNDELLNNSINRRQITNRKKSQDSDSNENNSEIDSEDQAQEMAKDQPEKTETFSETKNQIKTDEIPKVNTVENNKFQDTPENPESFENPDNEMFQENEYKREQMNGVFGQFNTYDKNNNPSEVSLKEKLTRREELKLISRLTRLRNKRIPFEIEEKILKEKEECTFHPQINPLELRTKYQININIPKNYENEIRRLRKAFEIKEEITKKLEMKNLGENWTKLRKLKRYAPSFVHRKKFGRNIILYIDINVGTNRTGRIALTENDDVFEVASNFCRTYSLSNTIIPELCYILQETLNRQLNYRNYNSYEQF